MNDRIAVCDVLGVALAPKHALYHCNFCFLYSAKYSALVKCEGCNFARYCSDRCKALDSDHKEECRHLQGKLEPWYNANRIWAKDGDVRSGAECALLMFRLYLKSQNCSEDELTGKFTTKTWDNLMTHSDEVKKDEEKMRSFRKCASFVDQILMDKMVEEKPADLEDRLFQIYCKIVINSHSVFVWTSNGNLKVIGISLGIDSSAYDHSCRPTAQILWQGRKIVVVPLENQLDAHDITRTFISYKYLVETKKTRRLNLKRDYHFTCECSRCKDLGDNQLSAISCAKCRAPVNLNESQATSDSNYCANLSCSNCEFKQPRKHVLDAVQLMLDIQMFFNEAKEEIPLDMLQRAEEILPRCNVYYGKLARKLAEDYECDPKSKSEFWVNHYNVMKLCSPENYVESLEVTLKCCFFLLKAGEFFKATGVFGEIESIVENYFILGPCPFERLLQYLYGCIVEKKVPKVDTFWTKE